MNGLIAGWKGKCMSENDKVFTGSIPEFYDAYLVPLIFEKYAEDMAARTAAHAPDSILEIAAGSGVVTRSLAPRLAAGARYTVTDLNQPMLDHAASRQGEDDRIYWQQADALNLPFGDASFDAVICQFGVMFFPDRGAGYREAHRVLAPQGRFIFNVWDHIKANEFAHIVTETAATIFPDDPPQFLARTPHGYHHVDQISEELKAAGFSDISVATLEEDSIGTSPRHPAVAYCQGTPLRNEIEARDATLLEHVTQQATEAIAAKFGDGEVVGKIKGHVITAIP